MKKQQEQEQKGIKKLQGFWVKFAEEQKLRRQKQNRPPELTATDQSYSTVVNKPSAPVQDSGDVLECSNYTYNPVRVLKSENTATDKSASRIQLGQDQRLYKTS